MRWRDLLFAHWPVPVEVLRPYVPSRLSIDPWDGRAWLGVVPFRMEDVAPRGVPALPGLSRFPELNLRTYVTHGERPGVWFFSLDAAQRLAVRAARLTFRLPYFDACMEVARVGEEIRYESRRVHRGAAPGVLRCAYRPTGPFIRAREGSIEHFLTERYCLYAGHDGRLLRGEVHHAPWPLQPATARFEENSLALALGVELTAAPTHLWFARDLQVAAWAPEVCGP